MSKFFDASRFAVLLFMALSIRITLASAELQPPLRLEEAIRRTWQASPQLQGQQTQTEIATGDRWRRFIFNEPQFQFTSSDDHTASSYGLQLTTAFPGKVFALTRLDAARERGQQSEYRAKKYDLAKLVAQSYLDCASAQATHKLQSSILVDLETLFQSLKALYETGHSTQAEKIGAELQARQARLDMRAAEDKQEILCRKLDTLMAASGLVGGTGKVTLPEDLENSLIQELGPATSDQSRAEAAADLAGANSYTAWWSQLPDLTFSASRNHYFYLPGSPSGNEWTTNYGVLITLPLLFPFHETVEAKRAKSQATIDENSAALQRISADSDQLDAAKEYRRSRDRLRELTATDLNLAEALVDSTFSAYRAGKLGYAELVLSRKTRSDLLALEIQLRSSIVTSHLRCLNRCDLAEDNSEKAGSP